MSDLLNRLKKLSQDKLQATENETLSAQPIEDSSSDVLSSDVLSSDIAPTESALKKEACETKTLSDTEGCNDCKFLYYNDANGTHDSFDIIKFIKEGNATSGSNNIFTNVNLEDNTTIKNLLSKIEVMDSRLSEIYPEGSMGLQVMIPQIMVEVLPKTNTVITKVLSEESLTLESYESSSNALDSLYSANTNCDINPESCLTVDSQNFALTM